MWQLLILLLIVVLVFGTKRLRNVGGDLGGAIKSFRKGMEDEPEEKGNEKLSADPEPEVQAKPSEHKSEASSRPPGSDV